MPDPITRIIFRRGTELEREGLLLTSGEPGFTIDSKRLYIGDGQTVGGISVGTKFLGFYGFGTLASNIPTTLAPLVNDLVYDTTTNILYALTGANYILRSSWAPIGINIQADNNTITKTIDTLSVRTNSLNGNYFSPTAIGRGLERIGGVNNKETIRVAEPGPGLTFTFDTLQVKNNSIVNDMLYIMPPDTVKGRLTVAGTPQDITFVTLANILAPILRPIINPPYNPGVSAPRYAYTNGIYINDFIDPPVFSIDTDFANFDTSGILFKTPVVISSTLTTTSNITGASIVARNSIQGAALNISGAITAGSLIASGNVTTGNIVANGSLAVGSISSSGNINANNITASAGLNGASATITGSLAANSISVTTNITASNLTASNSINSSSITTNNVTINGSCIVGGNIVASGNINATNVTVSNSIITKDISSSGTFAATIINTTGSISSSSISVSNALVAGSIASNSSITAAGDIIAYYTPSDKTIKNNLLAIQNPLDKVERITGYSFTFNEKAPSHLNGKNSYGVIAQEVESVLPDAVEDRPDNIKGVNYDALIPLLIESIKNLSVQIKELKKEVSILKNEV